MHYAESRRKKKTSMVRNQKREIVAFSWLPFRLSCLSESLARHCVAFAMAEVEFLQIRYTWGESVNSIRELLHWAGRGSGKTFSEIFLHQVKQILRKWISNPSYEVKIGFHWKYDWFSFHAIMFFVLLTVKATWLRDANPNRKIVFYGRKKNERKNAKQIITNSYKVGSISI